MERSAGGEFENCKASVEKHNLSHADTQLRSHARTKRSRFPVKGDGPKDDAQPPNSDNKIVYKRCVFPVIPVIQGFRNYGKSVSGTFLKPWNNWNNLENTVCKQLWKHIVCKRFYYTRTGITGKTHGLCHQLFEQLTNNWEKPCKYTHSEIRPTVVVALEVGRRARFVSLAVRCAGVHFVRCSFRRGSFQELTKIW